MKLSKLITGAPEIQIDGLMVDSRKKVKNGMFFCLTGMMNDGHKFISQAVDNGAICIVHSNEVEQYIEDIVYIKVENVMIVLNEVADIFFGKSSHKMLVYGVTGTNGKSTIALTIKNILNDFKPTGYIGTISIEYGEVKDLPLLTTPDVIPLHEILQKMHKAKMKAVSLEVSSHGLEQNRVNSIDFDIAIFTNLTHDHLDFHGTMENYYEAKKKLFTRLSEDKIAILNVDDPYGKRLVDEVDCKVITYGIMDQTVDYRASDIELYPDKTTFLLHCDESEYHVETNLVAKFNIYNLLAVIAALHQGGLTLDEIMSRINNIKQIDGRMERIDEGQPFNLIVDYAHTPDGFHKIYEYAKSITPKGNRIITVFGSAGKRDTKKRPILGEISDQYCDMVILTEEDPRGESVTGIAEDIAQGIKGRYLIIENRYDAIRQAIEMANVLDTVLVLAKGNETYMYREFGREDWLGDDKACREIIHKYYFLEEGDSNESIY